MLPAPDLYGSMDLWIYGSMDLWIYGSMDLRAYGSFISYSIDLHRYAGMPLSFCIGMAAILLDCVNILYIASTGGGLCLELIDGGGRCEQNMMNFVLETRKFVFKMMNFILKTRTFVFKMMNFILKRGILHFK